MTGLILVLALAGCGPLTERRATYGVHGGEKPSSSEPSVSTTMPASQIARAQFLLTDLGYQPGPANGIVGAETESAVRAFQEYEGLSVDGRMSAALLAQLELADRTLSVRRAQVRLLALGYDPGPIDGNVGPRTRAAISVYEQDRGLPVSGAVSPALLRHLRDEQPAPLPRPRLAEPQAQMTAGGEMPSPETAASLAMIATAAGAVPPAGETSLVGETAPPSPVDLEATAPLDNWGSTGSDERVAPAPVLPEAGVSVDPATAAPAAGQPLAPPLPDISLAALPDDAGRAGQPLAPGDRIRLAVGNEGADIIEREIDASGQLPLPGGLTVVAAGLTLAELERAIKIKLVESYLQSLSVEVSRSGAGGEAPPPQ